MLLFASRLVEEYDPSEIVRVQIQATELAGRKLVSARPGSSIPDFGECRARLFERKFVLPVEELRAELKQISAETMKQFVDFFPGPRVSLQDMFRGIERFEKRQF